MKSQPTAGEWVILVAGGLTLLGSFFDFANPGASAGIALHLRVWDSGLWPIAALSVLYGVVMAGQVALTRFAGAHLPDRIAGFTWPQLHLFLGLFATLMALSWLLAKVPGKGSGFWLIVFGSVGLLVGAVRVRAERPGP